MIETMGTDPLAVGGLVGFWREATGRDTLADLRSAHYRADDRAQAAVADRLVGEVDALHARLALHAPCVALVGRDDTAAGAVCDECLEIAAAALAGTVALCWHVGDLDPMVELLVPLALAMECVAANRVARGSATW